ncbi:matrix metalloproteinase-2-like [Bicyclus anynana]|uniref:Matrix metalloproteinase-2-like n=1 Tax=Bicyclus anynana TaxID=110368 RepID=A0ABM3LV28_BICAN|nr:matrix metalloproteinase-2-like [Bicyclus anynana]
MHLLILITVLLSTLGSVMGDHLVANAARDNLESEDSTIDIIEGSVGPEYNETWENIQYNKPIQTSPTTTTTRQPYIHQHHARRHRPNTPTYPTYYPKKPIHPGWSNNPTNPDQYTTTVEHPRRTNYRYPKQTETTTNATTNTYPRFPHARPKYPTSPQRIYPTYPGLDYPKRKPYPVNTTTINPLETLYTEKPDTCDTTYDAVTLIRGELFIFKNRYYWRIGANGPYPGHPIEITKMWAALPENLTHVDAVYERPDRKIAFFIGKKLYLFDSQYLIPGYPKDIVHLGLPEDLEKLDGAMVWGNNGKTYFYSGNMYWKLDDETGRIELDYPRDMLMWRGVGYNIDSVFQWKDGKTYFFKGKGFWKFDDLKMRVQYEKPLPSAQFWMSCPEDLPTCVLCLPSLGFLKHIFMKLIKIVLYLFP